jgi:type I restriction enzyme S subunit
MRLDSYPQYKQSGISWYQHIPKDWEVLPLFALAQECSSSNKGMVEDNLLSLSYGKVINKDINSNDGLLPESFETYQVVESDDIVLRLTDLQNDKRSLRSAIVKERGIITSAYVAIRPKNVDASFLNYLLRAYDLTKVFYSMGGGLRQSMKFSDVRRLPLILPSLLEQESIATFLDHETAKIDTLVAAQEKLIDLLSKKRQAVISHAVTQGLDPNVKLKDSGVEWMGQIPEHWVVKKLKFVADVMASNVDKKTYEGDTPCLLCNYTDVYYNDQIVKDMEFMSATATPEQIIKFTLKKGDVIITKDSESPDDIAIAAYVPMDLHGVVCGYHLSIVRAFEINGMFVKRLFDSHYLKSKFATLANGLTRYGLGQHSINNAYIPIPPEEEQQRIVDFINNTCNGIDDLIDKSKTSMNLLMERRSALIAAAVTGQIDVRNYQPKDLA